MINLNTEQKEILIFLLIALVVILLISFVSYIIYKECCTLPNSGRQEREAIDAFDVSLGGGEERRSAICLFSAAQGPTEYQSTVNIAGAAASPFLPQTATAPSAPSLGSFYSTSNVTELSSASAQEHQSNGFDDPEHPPTYQEAINQQR